ncbi:uncharacterized protein LOC124413276 isoform X1 [Diprion similis]|uniref:uncharacterized protein LOC124413276 isoform X1 n=1 Tax=Diprion similis TaxID=362088 RepID=UPI001EF8E626|nr:uncharacterized protein LOC124413276 isoform X1 [Diprion similis]
MLSWTTASWIFYRCWEVLQLPRCAIFEIAVKLLQFLFAIFNLIYQMLIFLRDLCDETMQTFANFFQGIVNVVSGISCDDIEDFASACIVVLLWIGVIKIVLNVLGKNPGPIQSDDLSDKSNSFYEEELNADKRFDLDGCPRKLRKRKKTLRRHNRGRIMQSTSSPQIDEELSD